MFKVYIIDFLTHSKKLQKVVLDIANVMTFIGVDLNCNVIYWIEKDLIAFFLVLLLNVMMMVSKTYKKLKILLIIFLKLKKLFSYALITIQNTMIFGCMITEKVGLTVLVDLDANILKIILVAMIFVLKIDKIRIKVSYYFTKINTCLFIIP